MLPPIPSFSGVDSVLADDSDFAVPEMHSLLYRWEYRVPLGAEITRSKTLMVLKPSLSA
jgi:hypothetical protein